MEKLRSPGLAIEDEGACCRVLADIGYFLVVNRYQSFFRDPSTRVYREGENRQEVRGRKPEGALVVYPRARPLQDVCAHGERLFSRGCHVEISDTALHAKLGIEKIGPDYACGKVDVFSAVIALRYLLRDDESKAFKAKLVKCVNGYLLSDESISEERLLEAMGSPVEWKKITRYKL